MVDTPIPQEELLDPVGIRFYPVYGRDPERTPMQWADVPGAGFTDAGVEPWLRFGDLSCNVEDQRRDPASFLSLCRDLIGLRDALPDLRSGTYTSIDAPEGMLAFRRGDRTVVALMLTADSGALEGITGAIRVCTNRERDGERVDGRLELARGEGAVVLLDAAPRLAPV
jgi:alpha-glucosidase